MVRDTVFISHATPEDDDFVRWLGARLTGHGYKVWADLFQLKGGDPFWHDIEVALRKRAIKMIFVVSKCSVDSGRAGVLNELSVADSLKKALQDESFIIPVRIDDTPYSDLPIQIHRLNVVDFSAGWGAKLIDVLEALEKANVPKSTESQSIAFERWRNVMARNSTVIEQSPEKVVTNLIPVNSLPEFITFYEHEGDVDAAKKALRAAGVPFSSYFRLLISLADFDELQARVSPDFQFKVRARVPFVDFVEGKSKGVTAPARTDARNIATGLLRVGIENHLQNLGLKKIEPTGAPAFFFPKGLIPSDKINYFSTSSGKKTYKNVVGLSKKNRVFWHLSMKVNFSLGPPTIVRFKPYLCFSEDGVNPIADFKRAGKIRRRFCRNWWNSHWRQLQEAFIAFLVADNPEITIRLNGSNELVLSPRLLELEAARGIPTDFSYSEEPEDPVEPDEQEDDDFDEDGVEGDDPESESLGDAA